MLNWIDGVNSLVQIIDFDYEIMNTNISSLLRANEELRMLYGSLHLIADTTMTTGFRLSPVAAGSEIINKIQFGDICSENAPEIISL